MIGSLPRVSPQMFDQVGGLGEAAGALAAGVAFLRMMGSQMLLESGSVKEDAGTFSAAIRGTLFHQTALQILRVYDDDLMESGGRRRILYGVDQTVFHQVGALGEGLLAAAALVGLLSCVGSPMFHQGGAFGKALVTFGAVIGLLPRVDSLVFD